MRRDAGRLEAEVLAVLAGAAGPMTVAEVQDGLGDQLAYTTVMTTLARLTGKGALQRIKDGRAFRYRLAAPTDRVEDAVAARRMHRMLGAGADKAGVLARFVAELDPEEERMLAQLLADTSADPEGQ